MNVQELMEMRVGSTFIRQGSEEVAYVRVPEGWIGRNLVLVDPESLRYIDRQGERGPDLDMPQYVDTVGRFEQRMRSVGLAVGLVNGSYESALSTLNALGLRGPTRRIGMVTSPRDTETWRLVPEGSVLTAGAIQSPHYMVALKQGDDPVILTGSLPRIHRDVIWTLAAVPDGTVVEPWREPRPNEADILARFKSLAWTGSLVHKERHEWCSVFETVMRTLGMDHNTPAYANAHGVTA